MRRPPPRHGWEPLIDRIRATLPSAAIRATVLLGHPGETDREFRHLLRFLQRTELDRVGVFRFSPQQGTVSATLEPPAPAEVDARMSETEALLTKQAHKQFHSLMGQDHRFMIDGQAASSGELACRPWFDAPEIDWAYTIKETHLNPGTILRGRVVGGRPGEVVVEPSDDGR
jgi:ribosomal protein S12 methylthiotransferase